MNSLFKIVAAAFLFRYLRPQRLFPGTGMIAGLIADVVQFICITAPSYADKPIAIVYPVGLVVHPKPHREGQQSDRQHEGNLRNHLKAAGLPNTGTARTWAADAQVHNFILDALKTVGKRNGLGRNEQLREVVMTTEEWWVLRHSKSSTRLPPANRTGRPTTEC